MFNVAEPCLLEDGTLERGLGGSIYGTPRHPGVSVLSLFWVGTAPLLTPGILAETALQVRDLEGEMLRTGQRIPHSGIYQVVHTAHPLAREVTLICGQTFPRCCKCEKPVRFVLLSARPALDDLENKIFLYELPIMEATEVKTAAA